MKFKKLIAFVLSASLCVSLAFGVGACGGTDNADETNKTDESGESVGTGDTDKTDESGEMVDSDADDTDIEEVEDNSNYVGKTYKVVAANLKYYYYDKEVTANSADGDEAEVYEDGVYTVQAYYEGITLTFDGDGESIKLTISDSSEDMGTGTAKYTLADGWFVFTDASGSVSDIDAETWLSSVSFGYDGENVIFYVVYRASAKMDSDGNVTDTTVVAYAQGAMEEVTI